MEYLEVTMEKIQLNGDKGYMNYGKIPYKIHYQSRSNDNKFINHRNPACFRITQDLLLSGEKNCSLSVWIHKTVPEEFIDIVMYHELVEAELIFNRGISRENAHKHAASLEDQYVEKFYDKEKLQRLKEWRRTSLDNY